jgi:hypothetical protein
MQDDQFSLRHRLGAILERFANREGNVDGVIAIRTKDLSNAYAYLRIAQLCLDHAREPEALKWAEEGLWKFEEGPDERLIVFVRSVPADRAHGGRRQTIVEYVRTKSKDGALPTAQVGGGRRPHTG